MKTLFAVLVFPCSLVCTTVAQLAPEPSASAAADYSVIERGPHHRVLAKVTWQTDALGRDTAQTNSYTELLGGMHYLKDGQWVESQDVVESYPGGAVARHGPVNVIFANNLATAGAIDMQTPDGKRLTSHVTGLSYFDAASGTNILIAAIKDCQGKILPPNQVLYEDAFQDLRASVRYTYTRGTFEQDVILLEAPQPPQNYGLSPATSRLVIMSEFIDAPQPVQQVSNSSDEAGTLLQDETLDFGELQIGAGKGMLLGNDGPQPEVRIWKQWATIEGRQFLIEQVPAVELFKAIASLPARLGASLKPPSEAIRFTASTSGRLPSFPLAKPSTNAMLLASAPLPEQGYLLDYSTVVTTNNFTFQADTTYFVRGSITLSGTTTMEGGTVIKYTNNATLSVASTLVLQTSQFRPVTFTSMHDNSVGEVITNSTGNPVRTTATYLSQATGTSFDYKHLRFRYAGTAVVNSSCPMLTFWHSQFLNCGTCAQAWFMGGGSYVVLYNVLMSQCDRDVSSPYSIVASGAHVTANAMTYLSGVVTNGGQYCYYTNSLARGVTSWTGTDPRYWMGGNVSDFVVSTSGTSPFAAVGAGSFYLAGSTYRNVGKTNLLAQLRSDLKKTTTYPPLVYSNVVISVSTNLEPQAQRDTDGPDLGYHFDPLDHAFSGVRVTNATVRLLPGTAIAAFGSTYGIGLLSGSQLICEGTPTNLNRIARFNLVQECSSTNWNGGSTSVKGDWLGGPTPAQAFFRFTDWSLPAQDGYHFSTYGYTMTNAFSDCQFHGGKLYLDAAAFTITNSLLERVNTSILDFSPMSPAIRNCLFYGGQLYVDRLYDGTWTFRDNLFDRAAINKPEGSVDATYNGFTTNTVNALGGTFNKTNLLSAYQTGPLGHYYYPASGSAYSLTNLINSGSTWATNVGLYYFTTTTNQAPEGVSRVDIGLHYAALGAGGMPIDANTNGVADYLEDGDGNGLGDGWEVQYFGHTGVDPYDDPDGDWLTNYQECLGNSNPLDRMVVAWGANSFGQCSVPLGLRNVVGLAGGIEHTMAQRADGGVVAWGRNNYGQTNVPLELTNATAIDAASYQSAALTANGTISNWGDTYGSPPPDLTNAVAIAAGEYHLVALRAGGQVTAWGSNSYGQTNVPSGLANVAAIAAGFCHSVALRSNGTVAVWGLNGDLVGWGVTNVPPGLAGVTAVAAGAYHTLALKADGTVAAWGAGNGTDTLFSFGQSIVPTGLSGVVAIAAGGFHSMALKNDGTITVWGDLEDPPDGQGSFVGLGAGDNHGLALRGGRLTPLILSHPISQVVLPGTNSSLSVWAVGLAEVRYQWRHNGVNEAGATNATLMLTGVQAADEGNYQVIVSTGADSVTSSSATVTLVTRPQVQATDPPTAGTNWVQTWPSLLSVTATAIGQDQAPLSYQWQLNGTNIPYATTSNYTTWALSSASDGDYSVAITNTVGSTNVTWHVKVLPPGGLYAWGADEHGQTAVPTFLTNVMGVAAGYAHSLVVKDDGTVAAWGDNEFGQSALPNGVSNITAVAAGAAHSLALKEDGSVLAWGRRDMGQTNVPSNVTNAIAISAGGQQSLALRKDGTVVQWGQANGTVPTGLANVTAIASGTNFQLALLSNTTVVAWGANDAGQTNVPNGLSNVVAIAAGGRHALALKSDGTVTAWGQTNSAQYTVPVGLSNVLSVAAGYDHSLALKNDGTVVAWGDGTYGQTNPVPTLSGVKAIAAGGHHSLAAIFSTWVQYPVDVAKDLLLIYNSNSVDSSNLCAYYLAHRPLVSAANVLAIGCDQDERTTSSKCGAEIVTPVLNWLTNNPTKHPVYVVFFYGIPTRLYSYPAGSGSVSYNLNQAYPGWKPFVMNINAGTLADCKGYVDKLEYFGTNFSSGKLVISAQAGRYSNTNYVVDNVRYGPGYPRDFTADGFRVSNATNGLVASGVSPSAILYGDGVETRTNGIVNFPHLTNATNVAGYICWGEHSSLGQTYGSDGTVKWSGDSRWWIIETIESYNGQRVQDSPMGNFIQWLSSSAFGGMNYSNTPVGVVSHVEEPGLAGVQNSALFFGLWAAGKNFAISAWNSTNTSYFQAIGDPLVVK